VVPRPQHCQLAYLSGPSFAAEVAAGMPTGLTIAARVRAAQMFMHNVLLKAAVVFAFGHQ
jgi:glycerol-3-phosphate dehydrogenase